MMTKQFKWRRSLKIRRIPFLIVLFVFAASSHSVRADEDEICSGLVLRQPLVYSNRPTYKGQDVQTVEINSIGRAGMPVMASGISTAVKYADAALTLVKPVVDRLVGPSLADIEISTGITGSLARYGLFKSANDIDIETQLILRANRGHTDDLFNSRSEAIRRVVKYLQTHVENTLLQNPAYRFIELKAGEFVDPADGEVHGIKWWLSDLRRGYKYVVEPTGRRRVSLAQAVAEPARIKIDWAVPAVLNPLNPLDYVEASVVYRLGMRVQNNQARLRVSVDLSKNERLPISPTSLALTWEDLDQLLEVSIAESPITIEGVHQALLKTIKKFEGQDQLKVARRVYALLSFWEHVPDYVTLTGHAVTQEQLLAEFERILTTPSIQLWSRIKTRAEIRQIAFEHGIQLPTSDAEWAHLVKQEYQMSSESVAGIMEEAHRRIEQELTTVLGTNTEFKSYLSYVSRRVQYVAEQPLTDQSAFLVIKPHAQYLKNLARKINVWKKKYPALDFGSAQDAHLTVHFTGQLTEKAMDRLIGVANQQQANLMLSGQSIQTVQLKQGGLRIIGRKDNMVAVRWDRSPLLSDVAQLLRAEAAAVGAKPEKTFLDFAPHVTVAYLTGRPDSRRQFNSLLQESAEALSEISFEGFEIWTRKKAGESVSDGAEYRRLR